MEVLAVFQDHQSRCAIRVDITTNHTYFIENTGSEYDVSKLRTEAFLKRFHLLDGYDPRRAAHIYLNNSSIFPTSAARQQLTAITENTMTEVKTFRAPSSNPFTKTMDAKVKEATAKTNPKKEVAEVQKKQEEAAKKAAPKVPLTPEKKSGKKAAPAPQAPAKKEAAPKAPAKKEAPAPAKKAAAAPAKEPKVIEDASAITVRLAKNPPAGVGLAKRDKVIVEILQANGKSMTLAKLLKEMGKQIDTSNGRTMESVWRHHGAPSQVLRSEGIITVK